MATPVPGQTVDLGVYDRFHARALWHGARFHEELLGYGRYGRYG